MRISALKFLLPTFVAAMALTSCSSDDDAPDYGADLAGDYTGWSSMTSGYFANMISLDQKVTVTKLTESTVSVSYVSSSTGTFTIPDVAVVKTGDVYTLTGAGTTAMGHSGNTRDYDCTFTGTLNAQDQTFIFSIPSVMGGTTVTMTAGELPETQYGYVVAGSTTGYFTAKTAYFDGMVEETQSAVELMANADGTVNVEVSSGTWGDINASNLKVTRSGNVFSVAGECTAEMSMSGGTPREYTGTIAITKNVADGGVTCVIELPVMGTLTLTFTEGDIPE